MMGCLLVVIRAVLLSDVQGKDSSVKTAVPVFRNQVHEDETNIRGGVPADASELPFVEKAVLLCLELQTFGDNLGEQFADHVQEGNGPKCFWDVVCRFLGLGDYARDGILQLIRPDAFINDLVKEDSEGLERALIFDD